MRVLRRIRRRNWRRCRKTEQILYEIDSSIDDLYKVMLYISLSD